MKLPIRLNSLSARLIILVFCATLFAWLLLAVSFTYEIRNQTAEQQHRQLEAYADMLWQGFGDDDDLPTVLPKRLEKRTILAFALYGADGILLAASSSPPLPQSVAENHAAEIAGKPWIVVVRQSAERRLVVGEPLSKREDIAEEVIERLGGPALLLLAVLLVVLVISIRQGLRPLRDLDSALSVKAPDNLEPIDLRTPREIAPLVRRLNALFRQVSETLERERRFTADASHELRTPLAALRVHVEIAQSSPRPEARQKALGQVLLGIDRITRLLSQLLELARLDHGVQPPSQAVDLAELAKQALLDAGLPCSDATLVVRPPAVCRGSAGLIALLLRNLLDNAVRYAGAEAQITVGVEGNTLTVADNGPGVAPDVLARLGQRFFRPPGQPQFGAGLGLSIAMRIAELHGSRLVLENRAAGGFQASCTLPG